jgi:agmatine deiminase
MNKVVIVIFAIVFIGGCKQKRQNVSNYFMPAEWETQEAVWLGYEDFEPFQKPFIDIAKALYPKIPLQIIADNDTSLAHLKTILNKNGIDTLKVRFHIIKDNKIWMRDHGATYVINQTGQKKVIDFGWTNYGNEAYLNTYFEGNKDSVAFYYHRNLAKTGLVDSLMGVAEGYESIKTNVNMEGGSIEVNGKGTLILCEAVAFQRNPTLSREYMEAEFKRVLGVHNIIWMKKGLVEDPLWFNQIFDNYYAAWTTNGHTDEFVRFVNDSTIALAWVDAAERNDNKFNQMNYEKMNENFSVLQKATDQNGKHFTIIKVPLPDPIYLKTKVTAGSDNSFLLDRSKWLVPTTWLPKKGMLKVGADINWVAASSYLNYLVTKNTVLLPTYTSQGSSKIKEERVKEIFSRLFPNRELIFIDVMNLNYNGGGIHCVTQQEPKGYVSNK